MRQYLGFIFYFICIAQILMFASVDIKAQEQKKIVYSNVLKTLEKHTCLECHSTDKKEGNVDLSNYEGVVKVLKPGHANQSLLVHAVEIKMMPALRFSDSSLPLSLFLEDLTFIEDWINSGAPIKQFKKIRKIFKDYACIDCHRPPSALAGVNLTTYEEVMKYVVPMDLDGSLLYNDLLSKYHGLEGIHSKHNRKLGVANVFHLIPNF